MEGSSPPAPGVQSPGSPPSPLWSRASSSSSLASSFRAEESFDFRGYPPQSELEEVPSFRWLRGDLSVAPAAGRSATKSGQWSEGYKLICEGHPKPSEPRSFAFDGLKGEKCAFLPAHALMVREDRDHQFWRCTGMYQQGKRSLQAVELLRGYYLDVRGTVDIATLPAAAEYAARLVFRLSGRAFGFGLQEASVGIGARTFKQDICLQPDSGAVPSVAKLPEEAGDGWMSIEMGKFFTERRRSRMDQSKQLLLGLKEGWKVEERNRMSWADEMELELRWKEGLEIGGVLLKPVAMDDRGAEGLIRGLRSLAVDKSNIFPQLRRRF